MQGWCIVKKIDQEVWKQGELVLADWEKIQMLAGGHMPTFVENWMEAEAQLIHIMEYTKNYVKAKGKFK